LKVSIALRALLLGTGWITAGIHPYIRLTLLGESDFFNQTRFRERDGLFLAALATFLLAFLVSANFAFVEKHGFYPFPIHPENTNGPRNPQTV
jgi:hypothetical protein